LLFSSTIIFIKTSDAIITQIRGRQTISFKKISAVSIIAVAALGMVLTYTAAGVISIQQANLSINRPLPSSGNIAALNVGIYSDYACTQKLESVDWGDIAPGGSTNKLIYLKNTGNTQITLSMTATNWSPTNADGPISLTWDKEDTKLSKGEVTTATLTLTVAESVIDITTFSVTILICGSA
jgi:hypothetical protein